MARTEAPTPSHARQAPALLATVAALSGCRESHPGDVRLIQVPRQDSNPARRDGDQLASPGFVGREGFEPPSRSAWRPRTQLLQRHPGFRPYASAGCLWPLDHRPGNPTHVMGRGLKEGASVSPPPCTSRNRTYGHRRDCLTWVSCTRPRVPAWTRTTSRCRVELRSLRVAAAPAATLFPPRRTGYPLGPWRARERMAA